MYITRIIRHQQITRNITVCNGKNISRNLFHTSVYYSPFNPYGIDKNNDLKSLEIKEEKKDKVININELATFSNAKTDSNQKNAKIYEPLQKKEITIFKLLCSDKSIKGEYIGYTSMKINETMKIYRNACNNLNNKDYYGTLFTNIRRNGGWENFVCEILEVFESDDKKEILKKKKEYIEKSGVNNTNVLKRPITSAEEDRNLNLNWKVVNKERDDAQKKEWNEKNKDLINERRREKYLLKKLENNRSVEDIEESVINAN